LPYDADDLNLDRHRSSIISPTPSVNQRRLVADASSKAAAKAYAAPGLPDSH